MFVLKDRWVCFISNRTCRCRAWFGRRYSWILCLTMMSPI